MYKQTNTICRPKRIRIFALIINCTTIMKTKSRFSRNVYAISDRIWCNKHLRHTTTEKYDNGKGWYFRFDDDNNIFFYHIFPWLCAWDVCYIIFCHLLHIRSGKTGICFHYYCVVYDECKYSDTFWLADHTRLIVQYTISLSSLCKLIWRHWTCLSDTFGRVCE